jgi:DNA (cytosine-5)-methyltransferase 1
VTLASGEYGVRLVRGPFVRLSPHPDHCENVDELQSLVARIRSENPQALLAADLFAGAGGLSLGLQQAGFHVVLSSDHYEEAVETHRHHFPGLSLDWDLAEASRIEALSEIIRTLEIDLLAGGPPCQPFSKAGRSGIRYRVQQGLRDPHDERRDLWRSFLEVVRLARPRAVVMENVPDMALDKEMFILRAMVEDLESMGYTVDERVVETWRYGVPQFRQRLILVALRDGVHFEWPREVGRRVTVWNAIGDLPPVEGGWRPEGGAEGYIEYDGPVSEFQHEMRAGVRAEDRDKVFDHITRPVRPDDHAVFESMDSKTRYSDLPEEYRRYRADIFDDKYKRLDENDLSRTITAHIAKDGYWYIHPRQPRTLTVREAARLQTFPDWYRFAGPPSAAFKQIGNAVPPMLARALGGALREALHKGRRRTWTTQGLANTLATWFEQRELLALPWLRAETPWQVVVSEILLDRLDWQYARAAWPFIEVYRTPRAIVDGAQGLRELGEMLGRVDRAETILQLAQGAVDRGKDGGNELPDGLPESLVDLVHLITAEYGADDASDPEPVLSTKGVLRPVGRYWGLPVEHKNRGTDGRLAVARLVGGGANFRSAHLGLIEIARGVCKPQRPQCHACPLAEGCADLRMRQATGASETLF